MRNGVLIIGAGNAIYGTFALNLALSIKAYDKDLPICLVTDANGQSVSGLNEEELSIFDHIVKADTKQYVVDGKPHYQRLKLCVDLLSPFEDGTMLVDADSIFFPDRKVSHLMGEFMNKDFAIGGNGCYNVKDRVNESKNYTYWGEPEKIVAYHKLTNNLPQCVSGLFWFRKCELVEELFFLAREIYDDPKAPKQAWRLGYADEYCINVAMSMLGLEQKYYHPLYFDKVHGSYSKQQMYYDFWGLAVGGTRVESGLAQLYDRLVRKYNLRLGRKSAPRFHVNKEKVISYK
jgi:hypothetical protein